MSDSILVTEKLTKQFGGLYAVNDVSLSFKTGQTHAILGPNGAGKSTLVDLLSGDLLPSSGHIFYKGKTSLGCRHTEFPNLVSVAATREPISFLTLLVSKTVGWQPSRDYPMQCVSFVPLIA